jgi:hypothetical protein
MKEKEQQPQQPKPFTPGITRSQVREHAFRIFKDKLNRGPLTVEDWVFAEKDLVNSMQTEETEEP